jgi:hypothetical protein
LKKAPPPAPRARTRPLRAVGLGLGVAALVVLAIQAFDLIPREDRGGVAGTLPPADARPPPDASPASAGAVALLGGLAPGEDVAGWTVVDIDASRDEVLARAIAVRLTRPDAEATVWITGREPGQRPPVRETKQYALFASNAPPDAADPADADREAAVEALAARVAAHEAQVPRPAELDRAAGRASD